MAVASLIAIANLSEPIAIANVIGHAIANRIAIANAIAIANTIARVNAIAIASVIENNCYRKYISTSNSKSKRSSNRKLNR